MDMWWKSMEGESLHHYDADMNRSVKQPWERGGNQWKGKHP